MKQKIIKEVKSNIILDYWLIFTLSSCVATIISAIEYYSTQ